jgi:DNA-binding NarL/FixJ family response regulator
MHSQAPYVARALHAGATGYLLKDCAGKDLIKAIATVASGKSYFSPAIAKLMLDEHVRRVATPELVDKYDSLSEREREIFRLIAEGRSNKAIAETLGISLATVETHRARILDQLDIHNTAALLLYAVGHGVIS